MSYFPNVPPQRLPHVQALVTATRQQTAIQDISLWARQRLHVKFELHAVAQKDNVAARVPYLRILPG